MQPHDNPQAAPAGQPGALDLAPCSALQDSREPDGFCVWCHAPYFAGDATYTHPVTREVHCSRECADDHDANL